MTSGSGSSSSVERAREQIAAGQFAAAEQVLRRVLPRQAADGLTNYLLAFALVAQGRSEQALFFAERACAVPGADAGAFDLLGTIHANARRNEAAIKAFREAIARNRALHSAHNGLGILLAQREDGGSSDEAAAAFAAARALAPEQSAYAANQVMALMNAWRERERADVLREAVARFPSDVGLGMSYAGILCSAEDVAPEVVLAEHRRVGALIESKVRRAAAGAVEERSAEGRALRIGFLSADFCRHSVASFVEPLLRELAGAGGAEVFCYSSVERADAVTERFRVLASGSGGWREVFGLDDEAAAAKIRADRLDVLIELGGYTAGSRLAVLSHRPTRLQGTYCGYPNTTGMPSVDIRIVDSMTDPAEESFCSERLVRIDPCFLCYGPPDGLPPVAPRADGGGVVFGSFNLLNKIGPGTITLWSEVLRAVPGSRLVLKARALAQPAVRARVARAFDEAGVESDRVECLGWTVDAEAHFALYGRIDVGLDPFPYNGTTTTCEALMMGVPVVSLAGRTHPSRVGLSLLNAAGLPELAGRTREQFVAIAAELASDPARRAVLRSTLRGRVLGSPLCDARGFAARFLAALRREVGEQESGR